MVGFSKFRTLLKGQEVIMALKEEEVINRTIDGKDYRFVSVAPGERDYRVTAQVVSRLESWSYEGEPNPKRADLCIAYHLIQKSKLTSAQLRWCASLGTGFALNAPKYFGFDADYDVAIDSVSDVLLERVKSVIEELAKADRMISHMARRSTRDGLTRTFVWLSPTGTGRFNGVKAALDNAVTKVHNLYPFKNDDD